MIRLKDLLNESFKPTDDTTMIMVGVDERKYPWYVKKIDSTHLYMSNDYKKITAVIPSHIAQYRTQSYYEDLRKWLLGSVKSKDLYGKEYFGIG